MYTASALLVLAFFSVFSEAVIPAPRWCVEGIEAFTKCIRIKKAMGGRIKCVLGKGEEDCFTKIAEKMADIATFDGGSIYHAGKAHGLKVIMSEKLKKLASAGTKYYGIAVVKKSSNLTYNTLKGAKSCHTGVWRTAGWVIPVGSLLSRGNMPCVDGDMYKSVSSFFSASCAGGANDKRYNPKLYGADKLCGICAGPGPFKCSRTNFEPYYGYQGAFKCMKDGAGDVAFIKESIVMALSPEDQAKYKLLCPDNTVKDVKDYMSCHLAGSPAHAVLTSKQANDYEITNYQALLKEIAYNYGKQAGNMNVFDGHLFSKYAIGLDDVPESKRGFMDYLGTGYANAIAKLELCS